MRKSPVTPDLRYAMQYRDGSRWRTAKSYRPAEHPYSMVVRVAAMCKLREINKGSRFTHWRVLLSPFNVLGEEID